MENIKPLFCDMSGIYGIMYPQKERIDMTDASGTNCYCDDAAGEIIRSRIGEYLYYGTPFSDVPVHFIDSGNYHYLSFFFMEKCSMLSLTKILSVLNNSSFVCVGIEFNSNFFIILG